LASCNPQPGTISGSVCDDNGPVAGAIVRVQTSELFTTTDSGGRFTLARLPADQPVTVTAWAPGYYIAGIERAVPSRTQSVQLELVAHTRVDNPGYTWLSAFAAGGDPGNCQNCHAQPGAPGSALPFDEWQLDAHSRSAQNVRFLTMYTGTDVSGNQSPETRRGFSRDYGSFPLSPDPTRPYYGPGYKLDFPRTAGNCAACHTPVAATEAPYEIDPTQVSGVAAEGIACDFCHKVWDVRLDGAGLPYLHMPGVLSFEFRRPPEGHQLFIGPYDDVAPGEDTFSPLQKQSQFCAPCHFGVFWETVVYNSFGEWLESPYSDPQTGQTCQDCHMPTGLASHFARPEEGGHTRDPDTIFSHRMLGASDEEFLQSALSLSVDVWKEDAEIVVQVDITNDNTGHHIPTDSPLRHMILVVQAMDSKGNRLAQLEGPTIPEWGGVGELSQGYYAGLPGTAYAKVLQEKWTEVYPTGAYWNPTRVLSDNRIPALGTDRTTYRFAAPGDEDVELDVKLLFRRAYIELMEQKGWDAPDILMAHRTLILE
jgi:mono/diheme cytochrome c family protein